VCDVTNEDQVKAAVERAEKRLAGWTSWSTVRSSSTKKASWICLLRSGTRQTAIHSDGDLSVHQVRARLMIEQGAGATSSTSSPPLGIRGSHAMWAIARAKADCSTYPLVAMELAEYGIRGEQPDADGYRPA